MYPILYWSTPGTEEATWETETDNEMYINLIKSDNNLIKIISMKVIVNFNQYVYFTLNFYPSELFSRCQSYSKGLKDKNVQIFFYKLKVKLCPLFCT